MVVVYTLFPWLNSQERKGHINSRESSGHRPGVPGTRGGQRSTKFFVSGVSWTPGRPGGFQKFYVIFSYVHISEDHLIHLDV